MPSNRRNEIMGEKKRAAIEAVLLAAGDRGMGSTELATAIGCTGKSCYYQATKSALVIHAKHNDVLSKWFHVEHAAAAEAYLEAVRTRVKKKLRWSEKTSAAAEQCVRDAGAQGADTQAISEAVGICVASVRPMMAEMRNAGRVAWANARGGIKLYFAPEHKPAAQEKRKHRAHPAPTRERVLRAINAAGAAGMNTAQIVEATGISVLGANAATNRLCKDGLAKVGLDARAGKSQPRRYWGAAFDVIPQPSKYACDPLRKSESKPAAARLVGDPIITAKTKFTVCPAGKDHRFTVHHPTRCLSDLPIGSYLNVESWASRAYA